MWRPSENFGDELKRIGVRARLLRLLCCVESIWHRWWGLLACTASCALRPVLIGLDHSRTLSGHTLAITSMCDPLQRSRPLLPYRQPSAHRPTSWRAAHVALPMLHHRQMPSRPWCSRALCTCCLPLRRPRPPNLLHLPRAPRPPFIPVRLPHSRTCHPRLRKRLFLPRLLPPGP